MPAHTDLTILDGRKTKEDTESLKIDELYKLIQLFLLLILGGEFSCYVHGVTQLINSGFVNSAPFTVDNTLTNETRSINSTELNYFIVLAYSLSCNGCVKSYSENSRQSSN